MAVEGTFKTGCSVLGMMSDIDYKVRKFFNTCTYFEFKKINIRLPFWNHVSARPVIILN